MLHPCDQPCKQGTTCQTPTQPPGTRSQQYPLVDVIVPGLCSQPPHKCSAQQRLPQVQLSAEFSSLQGAQHTTHNTSISHLCEQACPSHTQHGVTCACDRTELQAIGGRHHDFTLPTYSGFTNNTTMAPATLPTKHTRHDVVQYSPNPPPERTQHSLHSPHTH